MSEKVKESPTPENLDIWACFQLAQSEFGIVPATAQNSYFKKADGKMSAYSSLADIERTIRPILAKYKLCTKQRVTTADRTVTCITDIVHTSGSKIEGSEITIPTAKQDSQGFGSAITYCRRYSLIAELGLATEEPEDDGNNSSDLSKTGRENVAPPASVASRTPASTAPVAPAKPTFTPYGEDRAFEVYTLVDSIRGSATEDQLKAKFIATLKLFGYVPTPDVTAKKLFDLIASIPVEVGEKTKAYFSKKVAEAEAGKATTDVTPPADEARASLTPTAE